MKRYLLTLIFLIATSFVAQNLFAETFSATNSDGVTISYSTLTETTCAVSRGSYSGIVNIPSTVKYNNVTYTVTMIGRLAFSFSDELTSVTIPNTVQSIDYGAFYGCTSLTSLKIPDSMISISDFAFADCYGITQLTLGKNLENIGGQAFSSCRITSLTLPNSMKYIGNQAFWDCIGLTSVKIPKSVVTIFGNPFANCSRIESIVVESGNTHYNSANNCNAIIETSTGTLILGCKSTVIPNTVKAIGSSAFQDCNGLTSVTIPRSVTSIGENAFSGCYNLASIVVESGNTKFNSANNCNAIIESSTNTLIVGCRKTVIPNTVKVIGDNAFRDCYYLEEMKIPNSVTTIGQFAFYSCYNLKELNIPKSVTSIGDYAVSYCDDLEKLICYITDVFNTENMTFWGNVNATLYVPKGLVSKYQSAAGWNQISSIKEIPKSGDTNEDGNINISDVVTLVNRILGDSKAYYFYDTNDDGNINISDVVKLVNMILGN